MIPVAATKGESDGVLRALRDAGAVDGSPIGLDTKALAEKMTEIGVTGMTPTRAGEVVRQLIASAPNFPALLYGPDRRLRLTKHGEMLAGQLPR